MGDQWIEHVMQGESCEGGLTWIYLIPESAMEGRLSVMVVARTSEEDPKTPEPSVVDESDLDDHWSLSDQRRILGGETYEEYSEH